MTSPGAPERHTDLVYLHAKTESRDTHADAVAIHLLNDDIHNAHLIAQDNEGVCHFCSALHILLLYQARSQATESAGWLEAMARPGAGHEDLRLAVGGGGHEAGVARQWQQDEADT